MEEVLWKGIKTGSTRDTTRQKGFVPCVKRLCIDRRGDLVIEDSVSQRQRVVTWES